ncbi:unnamed protein product [Macrosiphum euphorbiae]|uniref:Integrase catalytic domain-containing protein n=1 Tax=Macrosiphum euphorbiae TaxID=13131 RepID=A0AAV0VN06_9HEMI|nr:unnamed protein product [Macrosiphum euphorbiae]CAI6345755.1 unnamed protein product [Macrosiphum euphorbiae]
MPLTAGDKERAERSLKRSIIKRDACAEQMLVLKNMIDTATTDKNILPIIIARKSDLEIFMSDFRIDQDDILTQLVDLDREVEFANVHASVTRTVHEYYYSINASFETLGLNKKETQHPVRSTNNLPKIQLPSFNGDILQWRSFRDTFISLVHSDTLLPAITKFHYLLAAVSGSAASVVRSVPLTEANYAIVWDALLERYDNKRLLLNAHLDSMFHLTPINTATLSNLKQFVTTFQENFAAIKALEVNDLSGFVLFYIASRTLDLNTKRLFESEYHDVAVPTLDMLLDFVKMRCNVLQNSSSSYVSAPRLNEKQYKPKSSFVTASSSDNTTCIVCKSNHNLYQCPKFTQRPVKQRFKFARSNKLCMNCLSSLHKTSDCKSTHTCRHCSLKHNSLLHLEFKTPARSSQHHNAEESSSERSTPSTSSGVDNSQFVGTSRCAANVVLGTAIVRIQNSAGAWTPIRVLVDPGSQVSIITNECVSRLGLKRRHCTTSVTGLSQTRVATTKGVVDCTIASIVHSITNESKIFCEPIILSKIIGLMPNMPLPNSIRSSYSHVLLADPQFDVPGPIDFLLGADVYPQILGPSSRALHIPGLPSALETTLGWIILGSSVDKGKSPKVTLMLTSEVTIDNLLRTFWEIEEPIPTNKFFTGDQKCEEFFCRTTTRDATGRFTLSLPFKHNSSLLGVSRDMAVARFLNLERKLIKDPEVYEQYRAFMREYEELGHMQLASRPGKYHIPHHAVIKRSAKTMKLRVVFDASAVSATGKSLNDMLHVGPKLQNDISDLLHRCRLHKYMFTADICKMYRQIKIHPDDCQYQHIVWRNDVSDPLQDYELTTVTYGVTSSPYQAIRVLHSLEETDGHRYPCASNILSTQTYVDDILTGHRTVDGIVKCQEHITQLLASAGFELKKWSSNCDELLRHIPKENQSINTSFDPKDNTSVKILGLHWTPTTDTFSYHTSAVPTIYTKRSILSTIAKLYDPIGALGPIIFWAKCYMQSLWQIKLQWDDPLPQSLCDIWKQYSSELSCVNKIRLPRFIACPDDSNVQLIGFSDASEKGYAAVIYLRICHADGNITIHFITSKSKVAPLKSANKDTSLTIPRLELCGALLLAQVLNRMIITFENIVPAGHIYAWTDSQVVLSWLTSSQQQFKTFVTNRLAKIVELLPMCNWRYVASQSNPADCVSRGLLPSQIIDHDLFWQGPPFLKTPESEWVVVCVNKLLPSHLPEYRSTMPKTCLASLVNVDVDWVTQFSSLKRMQRVVAFMLRFVNRARKLPIHDGPIQYTETEEAMLHIVRMTQRSYFANLFNTLKSQTSKVSPRSIAQLAPFVDKNHIIRVGGRLRQSQVPFETQNPILIPKSSIVTTLLIRHFHLTHLHAGPQLVSSLLSRRYWIISGRSAIRYVIFKCVTCARHRPTVIHPIMSDLPSSRVTPSRPFLHVGIDFAGPFMIAEGRRKNARSIKCYLSVFICMAVKAVHIEVVTDLSTEAFLAALQRFVARRGKPSDIYSDCGTNFKGADQQLRNTLLSSTARTRYINDIPCTWHFNPPAAPHFGGIWEAAVKSAKFHIKRVIGTQRLTFEEITTLAARVEAVLNSRPLVAPSADPNDFRALSPGDFLIGHPLVDIPESDVTAVAQNRLTRWELLRQMYQSFWKRWSTEYLTSLQGRSKWLDNKPNIKVGDLVLVHQPNQPPIQWKLGRIEHTHPGSDGVVRVATVRTATGTLVRPVVKLAILPIESQ